MAETQMNQEQIRFWNEQGGPRWVRLQQQLDEQINQLGLLAMQRAAVQSGERVLDVGCGCGQAALELAERVGSQGENDWVRVPLAAATRHVPLATPDSPDAPGPFAFANPDRVRSLLTTGGFTEVILEPHHAQLPMGGATTVDEAVDFALEIGIVSRLLADVSIDIRSRVTEDLRTALAPYANEKQVRLGSTVWIVTARRP